MNTRHQTLAAFIILLLMPAIAGYAQTPGTAAKKEPGKNGQVVTIPPQKKSDTETDAEKPVRHHAASFLITVDTSFNTKDLFLGAGFGANLFKRFPLYLNLVFYGRPYKKSVYIEEDTNRYYQYKEYRFVAGLCLDKPVTLIRGNSTTLGFFLSAGYGGTFGDLAGSTRRPEEGYLWFGSAGLQMEKWNAVMYRIGYQYMPIPVSPDHRAYLSVSYLFGRRGAP